MTADNLRDPRAAILRALDADDQRARAAMTNTPATSDLPSGWDFPCDTYVTDQGREAIRAAAAPVTVGTFTAALDPETILRRNTGVRAVVEMHHPVPRPVGPAHWQPICAGCTPDNGYNGSNRGGVVLADDCPTVRALADAYAPAAVSSAVPEETKA